MTASSGRYWTPASWKACVREGWLKSLRLEKGFPNPFWFAKAVPSTNLPATYLVLTILTATASESLSWTTLWGVMCGFSILTAYFLKNFTLPTVSKDTTLSDSPPFLNSSLSWEYTFLQLFDRVFNKDWRTTRWRRSVLRLRGSWPLAGYVSHGLPCCIWWRKSYLFMRHHANPRPNGT